MPFVEEASLLRWADGRASIIDGDTLEIQGERVRLWGIDAPEHDQLCRGEDSVPYRCGAKAADDLFDFIGQKPVVCLPKDRDRYGRIVAACSVAGSDLGEWLGYGLALNWSQYSHGHAPSTKRSRRSEDCGPAHWSNLGYSEAVFEIGSEFLNAPTGVPRSPARRLIGEAELGLASAVSEAFAKSP